MSSWTKQMYESIIRLSKLNIFNDEDTEVFCFVHNSNINYYLLIDIVSINHLSK